MLKAHFCFKARTIGLEGQMMMLVIFSLSAMALLVACKLSSKGPTMAMISLSLVNLVTLAATLPKSKPLSSKISSMGCPLMPPILFIFSTSRIMAFFMVLVTSAQGPVNSRLTPIL